MLRHQISYLLLTGFAVVMVILLMQNEPTTRQALLAEVQATQQSLRPVVLFPELQSPAQVYGLEVLDVATGRDILLMRDDTGLWYAPDVLQDGHTIPANRLNQVRAEGAANSIRVLMTSQTFDATPENFDVFGFKPQPDYLVRFIAKDSAGVSYAPVILEIGDVNPDNVAYYVWPRGDQRIYLLPKSMLDPLLGLLTESIQVMPAPEEPPTNSEVTAPVP